MCVGGTDNANGNNDDNNIIFTVKDTKLYVPVVTLLARDNQKVSKLQVNRIFINEKLAIKVIIDCRTTSAHEFRTRLGFEQYDVISTKEQSVLSKH